MPDPVMSRSEFLDLSTRVGLDSLTSFGEPKSNKDTDVKSWMFDTLAGAPVALIADYVRGANALSSGNFTKVTQLVPVRISVNLGNQPLLLGANVEVKIRVAN